MKKKFNSKYLLIFILQLFVFFFLRQETLCQGIEYYQNMYADKLATTTFRNGDKIFQATSNIEWYKACLSETPAWRYVLDDPNSTQGKLYNWYAIHDKRGLLPDGYEIASVEDVKYLNNIIKQIRENCSKSTESWFCSSDGTFVKSDNNTYWCSSEKDRCNAYSYGLACSNGYLYCDINERNKKYGFQIRLKRQEYDKEDNKEKVPFCIIGNQTWMMYNLDLTEFRNNKKIAFCKNNEDWQKFSKNKIPAYCYPKFDSTLVKKYGLMYNWFAINDTNGLAPDGWHIPTKEEYLTLITESGGMNQATKYLKSSCDWDGGYEYQSSSFSLLPAGSSNFIFSIDINLYFHGIGDYISLWTVSKNELNHAIAFSFNMEKASESEKYNESMLYVRCVKDTKSNSDKSSLLRNPYSFDEYSRKVIYKEVRIGNSIWMGSNLNVNTFRNGDDIEEARTNREWYEAGRFERPVWCKSHDGGKLYNWYAVNDSRNLAPEGWRIPNSNDFQYLTDYAVDEEDNNGDLLINAYDWNVYKKSVSFFSSFFNWIFGLNKSTNFQAKPSGIRDLHGEYSKVNESETGYWSVSPGFNKDNAKSLKLDKSGYYKNYVNAIPSISNKGDGYSVRCVK
jgi:uncharacterized protein (TIGR02145 family)